MNLRWSDFLAQSLFERNRPNMTGIAGLQEGGRARVIYNAFLSYSHAADTRVAQAVQKALHNFAKPWYRVRSMRIFRDKTSLSANPALWLALESALAASEWLLLLASPQSARSPWVEQELSWWLANRSPERLLILLTDGELVWDVEQRRFDASRTTALAPALLGRFANEPLYVDLRWARDEATFSLRHAQFRGAMLDIAAPLLARSKDELDGEDVRQHRRTRRAAWAAASGLVALTAVSCIAAYVAIQQSRIAQSRELAVSANSQLSVDPELAMLLARTGVERSPTVESQSALRAALLEPRGRRIVERPGAALWDVAFSADGSRLVSVGEEGMSVSETAKRTTTAPLRAPRLHSVAISGDGNYAMTADKAGGAQLWNLARGAVVAQIPGHRGVVRPAMLSPDSRTAVTFGEGGCVRLWAIATGAAVSELCGHQGLVRSAAFSPDGARLMTGGEDGAVRVWDVSTGRTVQDLHPPPRPVNQVAFSPDGRWAAAVARLGGTVQLWDTRSWSPAATIDGDDTVIDTVFSPDSARIALVDSLSSEVRVRSTRDGSELARLVGHTGRIFSVAFSPNGEFIVTASEDKTARVWDAGSGIAVASLRGHQGIVSSARFSPDGRQVATSSLDGTSRIWEFMKFTDVVEVSRPGFRVARAGLSPDGTRAWLMSSTAEVALLSFADNELRPVPRAAGRISDLALSPDGQTFVTTDSDGFIRLRRLTDGALVAAWLGPHGSAARVLFSPDGTRLLTSGSHAVLWDLQTKAAIATLDGRIASTGTAAFSRDGTRLVTVGGDAATVWGGRRGERIATLPATPSHAVTSATFSRDGQEVVTSSIDRIVRLWPTEESGPPREFKGHTDGVTGAWISPGGQFVVSVSQDRTARVWDVVTGRALAELRGDRDNWEAASFSPNGTLVLTSGGHNAATLWDARTGARLIEFDHGASAAKFTRDGRQIMVLAHGRLRLYACAECGEAPELLQIARARAARELNDEERRIFLHEK